MLKVYEKIDSIIAGAKQYQHAIIEISSTRSTYKQQTDYISIVVTRMKATRNNAISGKKHPV